MARKPPVAYSGMDLEPAEPPPSQTVETIDPVAAPRRGRPPAGKTLREASAPVMLYLHPAGLKALKRYALDQNTKVHSLLWKRSTHGINFCKSFIQPRGAAWRARFASRPQAVLEDQLLRQGE